MTVLTTAGAPARAVTPSQVLLHRRGAVYLPATHHTGENADAARGVDLLEADLLDRGWLLSPALRAAFVRLDTADLVGAGSQLLAGL